MASMADSIYGTTLTTYLHMFDSEIIFNRNGNSKMCMWTKIIQRTTVESRLKKEPGVFHKCSTCLTCNQYQFVSTLFQLLNYFFFLYFSVKGKKKKRIKLTKFMHGTVAPERKANKKKTLMLYHSWIDPFYDQDMQFWKITSTWSQFTPIFNIKMQTVLQSYILLMRTTINQNTHCIARTFRNSRSLCERKMKDCRGSHCHIEFLSNVHHDRQVNFILTFQWIRF